MFAEVGAQAAEQFGIFGEFFHEDLAGAVEHGLGVGKTGLGVDELFSFLVRRQVRIFEQAEGERLDTGFAGDLRLGAALLLVRQIKVFETLLGFGIADLGLEFRRQLALFVDAGEDGGTPLLKVAQVGQAFFEVA